MTGRSYLIYNVATMACGRTNMTVRECQRNVMSWCFFRLFKLQHRVIVIVIIVHRFEDMISVHGARSLCWYPGCTGQLGEWCTWLVFDPLSFWKNWNPWHSMAFHGSQFLNKQHPASAFFLLWRLCHKFWSAEVYNPDMFVRWIFLFTSTLQPRDMEFRMRNGFWNRIWLTFELKSCLRHSEATDFRWNHHFLGDQQLGQTGRPWPWCDHDSFLMFWWFRSRYDWDIWDGWDGWPYSRLHPPIHLGYP